MKIINKISMASLIGCCLCTLVCSLCYGQQRIGIKDVKKILISNSTGGMDDDLTITFEVIPENGRWNSYQTGYDVTEGLKHNIDKSTAVRKFVATVPATVINTFINGLNSIKPQFDWKAFGITPSILKAGLQLAKPAPPGTPDIDSLITDTAIKNALLALNKPGGWMDYGIHCHINVVTAKGSIIGMDTRNYEIGLLPWTLDEHKTYDIGITDLFNAAMGDGKYPNRYLFNDNKEMVWEKLEGSGPLYQYRWNYAYTENRALLKRNFYIKKVTFDQAAPPLLRSSVWCDLNSSDLSLNTIIRAKVDITDTGNIAQLIAFKEIASRFEKSGNFLFDFYIDKPNAQIVFLIPEKVIYSYIPWPGRAAMQLIPGIDKTVIDKIILLNIHTPVGDSDWGVMPDGKVILLYVSDNAVALAMPGILKNIDLAAFHTTKYFALFDTDGKQLK